MTTKTIKKLILKKFLITIFYRIGGETKKEHLEKKKFSLTPSNEQLLKSFENQVKQNLNENKKIK